MLRTHESREEGSEPAPDELRGRPPQRLDGRRPGPAGGHVAAEEAGSVPGEEQAAQDRTERLRVERRTGVGCDRLRSGIGLLCGDPALLDRKARDVSRRVDVRELVDPAVRVDHDEPVTRLRDAVDSRAAKRREGDDAVRLDRAGRKQVDLAVAYLGREEARVQDDAALVQQRPNRVARRAAEEQQRLVLRRDQGDPHVLEPAGLRVRGKHERELVRGQRPHRAERDGDDDPRHLSGVHPGDQIRRAAACPPARGR